MIMIMINHMCTHDQRARPLTIINRADISIASPIAIHLMYSNVAWTQLNQHTRAAYEPAVQPTGLPLGADTGFLVVHVKINEGGVSLQTRPICMDPVANASAHIHHQSSRVTFNVLTVVFPGRRGNTRLSRLIKYANTRANLQSCSQRSRSGVADCIERQV